MSNLLSPFSLLGLLKCFRRLSLKRPLRSFQRPCRRLPSHCPPRHHLWRQPHCRLRHPRHRLYRHCRHSPGRPLSTCHRPKCRRFYRTTLRRLFRMRVRRYRLKHLYPLVIGVRLSGPLLIARKVARKRTCHQCRLAKMTVSCAPRKRVVLPSQSARCRRLWHRRTSHRVRPCRCSTALH